MSVEKSIKNVISETKAIIKHLQQLPRPICDVKEIDEISQRSSQRNEAVSKLFLDFSGDELSQYITLLDEFKAADKELVTIATQLKSDMSKQLLKQKQNTKATRAYKSV